VQKEDSRTGLASRKKRGLKLRAVSGCEVDEAFSERS
jgi:hypothetical protein